MKHKFVLALVAGAMLSVPGFADNQADLDKQIKEFKAARDQAEAQAYEAGSRANQFLGQNWVDYQQAIKKQEFYENQAKLLDEKVKELEKQKAASK